MNRFKGRLEKRGKMLLSFSFNGRRFEVRCTEHSLIRFKDRHLDVNVSLGDIVSLGKDRLYKMADNGDDVAIINTPKHQSTIITFESEGDETQIRIRTIIDRSNIYVKTGTKIFKLQDYKGGF